MEWHEEIFSEAPEAPEAPEANHLVERRFYITDRKWSWAIIGDRRRMILTDNIGDNRVRLASPQRKRVLATAEKGPRRTDRWIVSFPEESGRQPLNAGIIDFAVAWMRTALYFDELASDETQHLYAPDAVSKLFGFPFPTDRQEYRTEDEYLAGRAFLQEERDKGRGKMAEALEKLRAAPKPGQSFGDLHLDIAKEWHPARGSS